MKKQINELVSRFFSITILLALTHSIATAQRVKDEKVDYKFVQLPLKPVDKTITNYHSEIRQDYIEDNKKKQAEYDAEVAAAQAKFDAEQAEYPALVKAAEDKYAEEMKAWEEKSLAEKVVEKQVLNENNKPVKQVPRAPVLQNVRAPKLQREYDTESLSNTYLVLDGFTKDPSNAVKIEVVMYGFEYTNPRVLTEQKNVVQNGTTSKVNYYHMEFTYRHVMSVRVTDPNGVELLKVAPSELNNYSKYATPASTTAPSTNNEALIATYEERIVQENLTFIYNLVNDHFGFKKQPRTSVISYVQENKGEYDDLTEAFNLTTSGLAALIDNKEFALDKLNQAIAKFEAILATADMDDKKARINEKVAIPVHINLLECYFAVGSINSADALLAKMNTFSLSRDERDWKETFEKLMLDTKTRIAANQ